MAGNPQQEASGRSNQGFRHASGHVDALLAAGEVPVGDLEKGFHHPHDRTQQTQHGRQCADVRQPGNLAGS